MLGPFQERGFIILGGGKRRRERVIRSADLCYEKSAGSKIYNAHTPRVTVLFTLSLSGTGLNNDSRCKGRIMGSVYYKREGGLVWGAGKRAGTVPYV